jgi:Mrp family chromosome partitioning ATPase/capsular polysaccharide biosynthesis protein
MAPPGGQRAEGALGPLVRAVRAHKLLVAVVTLAAVAGAVAWLVVRTPQYEATTQLLATPIPLDDASYHSVPGILRESGDPTRDIETAATVVDTVAAAAHTANDLGDGWTLDRVLDHVTVEPQGQSSVLAVKGTADSAELAARLANTFARAALSERAARLKDYADGEIPHLRELAASLPAGSAESATVGARLDALEAIRSGGDPTLQFFQAARVPDSAVGLSAPLALLLATIAGFALGCAAALLRELLERRVRDEEEARQINRLPILARVPVLRRRELRAATGPDWLMPPKIREPFRTLVAQIQQRRDSGVIMVTSASTGDGKTTSAINLATTLAATDRVVLLDLDLRKSDVARALRVNSPRPLSGLLNHSQNLDELLVGIPSFPNLSVLPISGGAETHLVEPITQVLPSLLQDARAAAPWVVLDTAPLGEISDALRIVPHVDEIVIVVRAGNTVRASLEVVRDLLDRTPGVEPTGMVAITRDETTSGYYHALGLESRPLGAMSER